MPEMTARWKTMLDGTPNDDSGGTDYLRAQSRAHPTNSTTRGASTAAEWIASVIAPDSVYPLKSQTPRLGSSGFGGGRAVNGEIVAQFIMLEEYAYESPTCSSRCLDPDGMCRPRGLFERGRATSAGGNDGSRS